MERVECNQRKGEEIGEAYNKLTAYLNKLNTSKFPVG